MKSKMLFIALAAVATQATAGADPRIAQLCGPDHVNEAVSAGDVRSNPDGFYVASLSEQLSLGDPRIVMTTGAEFHLCTRSAATPEMDAAKASLLMRERTVKYLFAPFAPREPDHSS